MSMSERADASPGDEAVAVVVVATADDAKAALALAAPFGGLEPPLVGDAVVLLPPPPSTDLVRQVVGLLTGGRADAARPSTFAAFGSRWALVPSNPGARRFAEVRVPARLVRRQRLLAMPLPMDRRPSSPMLLLAMFADPRQQLVAKFGADPGAPAELASPLRPAFTVLLGRFEHQTVVVASRDLVAAELIARAWPSDDEDDVVPWQHPVVQRAIDLGLGINAAGRLRLLSLGAGGAGVVARLAPRLGIAEDGRSGGGTG